MTHIEKIKRSSVVKLYVRWAYDVDCAEKMHVLFYAVCLCTRLCKLIC